MKLAEPSLIRHLQRKESTAKELAKNFDCRIPDIHAAIKQLKNKGILVTKVADRWCIASQPVVKKTRQVYMSRPDNTYVFGIVGDTHLGSNYERLDVLNDLYDIFESHGVDRVFHQGNYIEGESVFNRFELKVHGMDNQVNHLVSHYPEKDFTTYAITGDDHEGWYCQRSGVDIGGLVDLRMRDAGRTDWHDLGYMEAFVDLKNVNSKKTNKLLSMHPGGGSAYAYSYRPQKIVESLQGGEKPGILLIGHYHKISYNMIRGVHVLQTGCTQDQSAFMRKKSLEAHVGGGIVKLTQDPKTGAIFGCQVEFFHYFSRSYTNGRWGYSGVIQLADRSR